MPVCRPGQTEPCTEGESVAAAAAAPPDPVSALCLKHGGGDRPAGPSTTTRWTAAAQEHVTASGAHAETSVGGTAPFE